MKNVLGVWCVPSGRSGRHRVMKHEPFPFMVLWSMILVDSVVLYLLYLICVCVVSGHLLYLLYLICVGRVASTPPLTNFTLLDLT